MSHHQFIYINFKNKIKKINFSKSHKNNYKTIVNAAYEKIPYQSLAKQKISCFNKVKKNNKNIKTTTKTAEPQNFALSLSKLL